MGCVKECAHPCVDASLRLLGAHWEHSGSLWAFTKLRAKFEFKWRFTHSVSTKRFFLKRVICGETMETSLKSTPHSVKRWQLSGTDYEARSLQTRFSCWTPLNNKAGNLQVREAKHLEPDSTQISDILTPN